MARNLKSISLSSDTVSTFLLFQDQSISHLSRQDSVLSISLHSLLGISPKIRYGDELSRVLSHQWY